VRQELRELYQEVILDHTRNPRNHREIAGATHTSEGFNPLCGDRATVFVSLEGDTVRDVSFVGKGCSIATASASMMTEALKGKSRAEADRLFEEFHALITSAPDKTGDAVSPALGKLLAFSGVSEFPLRVKCASLPWHTMKAALEGRDEPVSTE
jgi:nitrogen fixation NifU-like protein